ncbi:uncharacterized protein LOC131053829 [Cryptomeria japonica]|uniref:uncharacterized protein LOC131053829 n=1 Tax=Cryptomeria japonica TaxID=3369 RepID=UPI0027DAAEE5|nr:uncharacterized protein LOC131053829 [Cryptomeria japonica]
MALAEEAGQITPMEEEASFVNRSQEMSQEETENIKENFSEKELFQMLSIIAALVFSVTLAAAFTVPGRMRNEQGIPVPMHSAAINAFITSNTLAMCLSVFALLPLLLRKSFSAFLLQDEICKFDRNLGNQKSGYAFASELVSLAFVAAMISYSTDFYVLIGGRKMDRQARKLGANFLDS